jgi:two-component system, chemotaxis family, protein-glutamate methylesterase/glutaminase
VSRAALPASGLPALGRSIDAIALGASAGGVEALLALLAALRPGLGLAVFVVLHLPPDRSSLLVEVFAPRCALPVREAQDKELVAPGTVYFAPPDYHLLIDDGPLLTLSVDPAVHHSRPSIDVLFESAAEVYGERLMGIILTGGSADGAAGLLAVQRAGGITVVQQPETALVPTMPASALQLVAADLVLPMEGIAGLMGRIGSDGTLH